MLHFPEFLNNILGKISTYTGGGYVGYLGRTLHNTYANFIHFLKKYWLDRNTRSVFIEFLTYNVNYNIFNAVRLIFEQSATGYSVKTINVSCFKQNETEIKNKVVGGTCTDAFWPIRSSKNDIYFFRIVCDLGYNAFFQAVY